MISNLRESLGDGLIAGFTGENCNAGRPSQSISRVNCPRCFALRRWRAGGTEGWHEHGRHARAAPAAPDRAAAKPDESATQPAAPAEATSPAPASPAAEVPANKPQAASGGDEVPATAIVNTAPIVVSTESTPATTAPASPAAEAPADKPQAGSGGDEVPAAGALNAAPVVASTGSTTAATPAAAAATSNAAAPSPAGAVPAAISTLTRRSAASCTNLPMASSTASSAARKNGRLSKGSIPAATMRRFGSPTARPMRARRPQSLISAKSMPTVSIRPIIRLRISPHLQIRRRSRRQS